MSLYYIKMFMARGLSQYDKVALLQLYCGICSALCLRVNKVFQKIRASCVTAK